jgi:hypothetical protein
MPAGLCERADEAMEARFGVPSTPGSRIPQTLSPACPAVGGVPALVGVVASPCEPSFGGSGSTGTQVTPGWRSRRISSQARITPSRASRGSIG